MALISVTPDHALRTEAEACIQRSYGLTYGARVVQFPKLLMALANCDGVQAVAGLRTEADGFFCERYLAKNIPATLKQVANATADNATIVEVTSLAALRPSSFLRLIMTLRTWIPRRGFEWAIFTATERLRQTLQTQNLPLIPLAKADPSCVGNAVDWGSYYATDPMVCAVARDHLLARTAGRIDRGSVTAAAF